MVEKLQAEGVEATCGIRVGDRGTRQWPELGWERGWTIEWGGRWKRGANKVERRGWYRRNGTETKKGLEQRVRQRTGWDGKQQKFASQSRIEIITRETRARKGWRNTDADANADGQVVVEQEGLRRRGKGWKHNGNTARNADTRIRRRFVEATKKKKRTKLAMAWKERKKLKRERVGVEETEWIWRRREKGPVSLLCLHGASERKSGKERDSKRAAGSRHRLHPLDVPVSRNCWINNCRTEQKNRKHGNSVIYCASSVRYCENSETFVCEGEKM